jgi:hypothetical protein
MQDVEGLGFEHRTAFPLMWRLVLARLSGPLFK